MLRKLMRRLRGGSTHAEEDVRPDPHQVTGKPTGGARLPEDPDAHSTTAPSRNETYVGRVSGEDSGDPGETGAERRAQHSSVDENATRE